MVIEVTDIQGDLDGSGTELRDPQSGEFANSDCTVLLDEALARISRLEAALAVTGGTIHDVNNLLTVLSGNLFILTESVREDEKLYGKVRAARNTAEKCGALMRELLTFARNADKGEQVICPANHLESMEPLLSRSIGARHTLNVHVPKDPWSVDASAVQYESAVTNLVINARDALHDVGTINVSADNVAVTEKMAEELGITNGDYVCTRVVDNGSGIPRKYLHRVIEPMFTTKGSSRGTGLGLSMVQRFAVKNRGVIRIRSREKAGTEVQIWLPKSTKEAEVTANMTLPLTTLKGGDEPVILVSLDEAVRTAIRDILEALGYTVILAALGQPIYRNPKVDLAESILVCERTVENRASEEGWIELLRKNFPDIKHVAVLTADACPEEVAPNADSYLRRPIAVMQLADAMRNAVESKS